MKKEINVPDVATITVCGPVGCGKSAVMLRLREVLEKEFSARVVLNDELNGAVNAGEDRIPKWLSGTIKETIWLLCE